jgi:hypothetical protein
MTRRKGWTFTELVKKYGKHAALVLWAALGVYGATKGLRAPALPERLEFELQPAFESKRAYPRTVTYGAESKQIGRGLFSEKSISDKSSPSYPLSDKDVRKILGSQGRSVRIVGYPSLHRFRSVDQLLGRGGAAVILVEQEPGQGHWTGLVRVDPKTLEWFDPLGVRIDRQLAKIDPAMRHQLHEATPWLSRLIGRSRYERVIQNDARIQRQSPSINTCGRHTALRILNRKIPIDQYIQAVRSAAKAERISPDEFVTAATDELL